MGMGIPEHVHMVLSVTTGRPEAVDTPVGNFLYRHIKKEWFFGYSFVDLSSSQSAFVALPEKALLDLVYVTPRNETREYLQELRLQNLSQLDLGKLQSFAVRSKRPKLKRAVEVIARMLQREID